VVCTFFLPLAIYDLESVLGQLPFLNHEHHVISPLPLIMKYLSALKSATKSDRADKRSNQGTEQAADVAWRAHVESHLGDVVVSILY